MAEVAGGTGLAYVAAAESLEGAGKVAFFIGALAPPGIALYCWWDLPWYYRIAPLLVWGMLGLLVGVVMYVAHAILNAMMLKREWIALLVLLGGLTATSTTWLPYAEALGQAGKPSEVSR